MKFFFPDSQDLVDPSYDFERESRSDTRLRQRDDVYAHEVFQSPPFNGILVSKAIVDGISGNSGRYTLAQRHRLLRHGVRDFFRLKNKPLETMGDCGAFSYFNAEYPPYSVDEVIHFYSECDFDYGISVDHMILAYKPEFDQQMLPGIDPVPHEFRRRQEITLELASSFLSTNRSQGCRFTPLGVAQGWSPRSYAYVVKELQKMGYRYIAMGGMVPLKSEHIVETLETVNTIRFPDTKLHLLGITRFEHLGTFQKYGVVSFDSTSPLRQAFKDEKDNYYTADRTYSAIRIPQVEGNPKLKRRILSGEVNQTEAIRLEKECLHKMHQFDEGNATLDDVLSSLVEYEQLYDGEKTRADVYRESLVASPWKKCPCDVCKALRFHVILFRGAERNRRRGFHNLYVFYQRFQAELSMLRGQTTRHTTSNL